jgi:hypothetical protein
VLWERWGLSIDLREEEEVRTTAGDDGAAADMVNALYHGTRSAGSRCRPRLAQTHWAWSERRGDHDKDYRDNVKRLLCRFSVGIAA